MSEQYIVIFTSREENWRLTCQVLGREKEDPSKTMERQCRKGHVVDGIERRRRAGQEQLATTQVATTGRLATKVVVHCNLFRVSDMSIFGS